MFGKYNELAFWETQMLIDSESLYTGDFLLHSYWPENQILEKCLCLVSDLPSNVSTKFYLFFFQITSILFTQSCICGKYSF